MSAPLADLIARFRKDIERIATDATAIAATADGLLTRLAAIGALAAPPVPVVVAPPPAAPCRRRALLS